MIARTSDIPPPAHLAPYVEELGVEVAVAFLLAFGGAELYLARDPKGRSRLVEVVGLEGARRLGERAALRGLPARVPTGKPWIARVLHAQGLSKAEIARRLHTSDVTVRGYLADAKSDPRQPSLL